jgi:hypothetical protein
LAKILHCQKNIALERKKETAKLSAGVSGVQTSSHFATADAKIVDLQHDAARSRLRDLRIEMAPSSRTCIPIRKEKKKKMGHP